MPSELQCIRPRSSYPVKASLGVSVGLACGHIQCTSLMLTPSTGPCPVEEAEPTHLSEKSKSASQPAVSDSLQPRLLCPWNSPGKNTGVGSVHHRIFPNQGLNPGRLHGRQILYYLSHQVPP